MAQGGIQVPFPSAESRQAMLDDMTRSARVAVDLTRVRRFIDAIPETVSQLEAWGLALDRDESGAVVRRRAGGLSEPRIVSTGGGLGPQLMAALRRGLEESGAELRTGTRVVGITPGAEGIALDVVGADGAGRVHRKGRRGQHRRPEPRRRRRPRGAVDEPGQRQRSHGGPGA